MSADPRQAPVVSKLGQPDQGVTTALSPAVVCNVKLVNCSLVCWSHPCSVSFLSLL